MALGLVGLRYQIKKLPFSLHGHNVSHTVICTETNTGQICVTGATHTSKISQAGEKRIFKHSSNIFKLQIASSNLHLSSSSCSSGVRVGRAAMQGTWRMHLRGNMWEGGTWALVQGTCKQDEQGHKLLDERNKSSNSLMSLLSICIWASFSLACAF
jgi:hypothetical protein